MRRRFFEAWQDVVEQARDQRVVAMHHRQRIMRKRVFIAWLAEARRGRDREALRERRALVQQRR
jgi:hypothetical protein